MKKRAKLAGAVLISVMVLAGVPGCGDDDGAGDNNNNIGQDAGPDAAPDAQADADTQESITFTVMVYSTDDATNVTVEGAPVAFDHPGGWRVEADTDANGQVTFDNVDWTLGTAAVTAYVPEHAVTSHVGLDEAYLAEWVDENGDYIIYLQTRMPDPPADLVRVSGTATAMADVAHEYVVNSVNTEIQGTEWRGTGDATYTIQVGRGETFAIQAIEQEFTELPSGQGYDRPIYNVMQMDYGPLTANESGVLLDFGAWGMATFTGDVTLDMPARTDSPIRTGQIPYCFVCASNSNYCHGWPTYVDVVNNQSLIDISFLWVAPAYVEGEHWFCAVATDDGEQSQIYLDAPPDQITSGTLPDTPEWVTPADPLITSQAHDPIEWVWHQPVSSSNVAYIRSGNVFWYMHCGADATSATLPDPPSGVNENSLFSAGSTMVVFGGDTFDDGGWERYAHGFPASVTN